MTCIEFETSNVPRVILLSFNHNSKACKYMEFEGERAFTRAVEHREDAEDVNPACSWTIIANEIAQIEFTQEILNEMGDMFTDEDLEIDHGDTPTS